MVEDQIPDRLPPVSGQVSQLDQVFLNLLLNARDAVESAEQSASHITVSVEEVSFEEKEVAAYPSNHSGAHQGTGLGLATAYAIVQQHHGWIECRSEPGVGTTFSVFLPVASDPTTVPEVEAEDVVKGGSETILFVEDEEDVRQSVVDMLQTYGYHVLIADDGLEGWAVFRRHQQDIDLVLLDLSMPNMSSQELLARIRTVDPTARVLISTGRDDAQLPNETILRKPYEMIHVLATIRSMLDTPGYGDRARRCTGDSKPRPMAVAGTPSADDRRDITREK